MPRLFSYCIPIDNGSAPNPFWGICTLNICKPVIRRNANKGDWIVATGSKQFGFENKVVYAMEVTEKLTMQQYADYCNTNIPEKIPNWSSGNYEERVGDCIYSFLADPPEVLKSVHDDGNRIRDLGGKFALLSDHFYYFGNNPEQLPDHLLPIVRHGQGHRSTANQSYYFKFEDWILKQTKAKNKVYSAPKDRHLCMLDNEHMCRCAAYDKEQDDLDEQFSDE